MSHTDSWKELLLGGVEIPLTGPLPDNNLATFQRRITIGDANLDSNPLLSAWVMSDFSGGHGVEDLNESTDTTRYNIGTFYTRYPKMITKIYKSTVVSSSVTADLSWRFLGDLNVGGTWTAIALAGIAPSLNREVNSLPYGGSLTLEGTLTATPVNTCTVFRGTGTNDKLFIPMGASGYATVEATAGFTFANVAADATHPALVHAEVLGYKLVGIDTAGVLWQTTDASTWSKIGANSNLPTSETPRKLISYFDRNNGQPTLFILSDMSLYQFDDSGPNIFSIDVSFPPHPYGGLGACKWNGDLYFSVGMGVYRYTGGSLSSVGLDRDSGLPQSFAGYISDLVPGHNAMYAMVQSPYSLATPRAGIASIHEYTGFGWHMIWSGNNASTTGTTALPRATPYSMGISRSGGEYSLFHGTTNPNAIAQGLSRISLPVSASNPRARTQILSTDFNSSGNAYMYSGIFDAGMRGYTKVAAALDINIEVMDAAAQFDVGYRTTGFDGAYGGFYFFPTITTAGSHHLQFGTLTSEGIYPGVTFEKIQLYFQLQDATANPFLWESAVLGFVKTLPPSNSYTAQVDLSKQHAGRSPDVILQHIYDLMDARVFTDMTYRGVTRRVMISQFSGTQETGSDERSFRTLSLLEIPDGLDIE